MRVAQPGRGWSWARGAGAALAGLVIASMPLPGTRAAAAPRGDANAALFTETFRHIRDYYIDSIPLETLTLAALRKLDDGDNDFSVGLDGRSLVVSDHGREVARLAEPAARDAEGWSNLIAGALPIARAHVPGLAAESDEALDQRLFDGLMPQLDRFSRYAAPATARDQRAQRDGFGGIGVTLDYSQPEPRIAAILEASPAAQSDLRVDDRLITVDGAAVTSSEQAHISDVLRGPIDTVVTLGLRRGGRRVSVMLRRGLIVAPTVTEELEDGVAILRISTFNHATADSLATAIDKARALAGPALKGYVLDLRNNPGGLLDQAVEAASLFLDHGLVVTTRGRHPTATQRFEASGQDRTEGARLVVLVNGGSASAAEIVAVALQDEGRALLVGSASYGKGTVQMVVALPNQGELTLTWARLFSPAGYLLHEHGVVPTFCTNRPADPLASPDDASARVARLIESGLRPAATPRLTLDESGWQSLRQACPAETRENPLDLAVARRLVREPVLYARGLAETGPLVARAPGFAAETGHGSGPALQ